MNIFWFLKAADADFKATQTRDELKRMRVTLWLFVALVAIFLSWANWAELDQITRAQGRVIASSKTQVVQSQEGGVVEELLVREGDRVKQGDAVLVLERTQVESSYLEAVARQAGILAAIARLRAEVFGGPIEFDPLVGEYPNFVESQRALYKKRQSSIEEEIGSLERMADLVDQELALNRPLAATGDVSKADILRLERQKADIGSQITNIQNRYFEDAQAELSKLEEELAGVQQQVNLRKDRLEQYILRAPVNGIVKNIGISTGGGVVRPGEEVLQIVPLDDRLIIEARVSPAEIAFIDQGMSAVVKLDAYDYTLYGDLSGQLTYISADTLTDETSRDQTPFYRIQVETEGRRFKGGVQQELPILPGMTAVVELKTGSNTVLHYLTKPLVKTLSESLGER